MDSITSGNQTGPVPGAFINLEALEAEIARLWRPESAVDGAMQLMPSRAVVINLVVVTDGNTDQVRRLTERISVLHPSRVICFDLVDDADAQGEPRVAVQCERGPHDPRSPCLELITIPTTRAMLPQVAAIVQPMLLPGLPSFLWWPGPAPVDDPSVAKIASTLDGVILDSQDQPHAGRIAGVARLQQTLPARTALIDLNWERIKLWRELTAQLFDVQDSQWALEHVREFEVETGPVAGGGLPPQALLIASWVAFCLSWDITSARKARPDTWVMTATRAGSDQTIPIRMRTRPCPPEYAGQILSVAIDARDGEHTASLGLTRTGRMSTIRMRASVSGKTALHHAVHHPPASDEALLAQLLQPAEKDRVFYATLDHAQRLIASFERRGDEI
jgi:glucose-6-phosphate dehydrogenase assembly protein OpcA